MLSAHDPIILPEKTEILCFCQGESEFLKYIVFYLSSNELLIYSYSKHSNEIAFEFIPWSKNFKIISMEFSLLHNFLHILTTSNTYIIMPFCMLLEKSKRKQWEDYVLSKKFGNSESYQKQSQNSFLG